MKLTALEIKQQQFEKSLRGYDPAEVNSFLNLIASEWEHMVGKIRELEAQLEKLENKLNHYERVEQALHETLQTAKDSADQKLVSAKEEAKIIIEKAELEAGSIVQDANQQRQEVRQSILRLIDRRKEIIGGIKSYLDMGQESLEQFRNDEASLFTLPKESEASISLKEDMEVEKPVKKASGKQKPNEAASSPNIDDILDELD